MALTSEEITKIVQSAFAKVKDTGKPEPAYKQSPSDDKKQAPDYYPYYRQCILNVEAIMTHAIKGYYPEHLFRNPSPIRRMPKQSIFATITSRPPCRCTSIICPPSCGPSMTTTGILIIPGKRRNEWKRKHSGPMWRKSFRYMDPWRNL